MNTNHPLSETFYRDLNAWCARFDLGEHPPADDPAAAVESLFGLAARAGASAIHCEPLRDRVAVRLRIDGLLHEVSAPRPTRRR
jgi:type II secretory ATPase GspE/PulE/Tfp pilus assembly ATPase PilB-like protein